MHLKSGFSVERNCYIHNNISLSVCPPLSIYIYTVAFHEGAGGKMLHLSPPPSPLPNFKNLIGSLQNIVGKFSRLPLWRQSRFTQQAVVIFSCLAYQYCDSIKGY